MQTDLRSRIVLLFGSQEMSDLVGGVLWRTIEEIRQFYKADGTRSEPLQIPIMGRITRTVSLRIDRSILTMWPSREVDRPPPTPALKDSLQALWRDVGPDVVDPWAIARGVRSIMSQHAPGELDDDRSLIVVTDSLLDPRSEQSAVVWFNSSAGIVMSMRIVDPDFWSGRAPEKRTMVSKLFGIDPATKLRQRLIKQRVRSVLIGLVGLQLGMEMCSNNECFMSSSILDPSFLDEMRLIGDEHGVAELSGQVFEERNDVDHLDEIESLEPV